MFVLQDTEDLCLLHFYNRYADEYDEKENKTYLIKNQKVMYKK